ncbi:MAG: hypothetical protein HDQ93_06695 [Desulfovibrio sp.]|nr:hypothetical protein [Desulfovibrio sp.]
MNPASSKLIDLVFGLLYGCDLIYSRMPRPREDLLRAAELFAGDIADLARDLPPSDIEDAFREHRRSSPFYPRPSDINKILVYTRAKRFAPPPIPKPDPAPASPGTPETAFRALKGDATARELIERLLSRSRD